MASKWNSNIQFPTDSNFVNRIVEAEFGESKNSGNPMVTLELEVVTPAEVEIGGVMYNIAGVGCKQYYTTLCMDNGELYLHICYLYLTIDL